VFKAAAAVLALGGASWPETGSDAAWVPVLRQGGIEVAPLQPANCGWQVAWPEAVLRAAEGKPLKNIALSAGECRAEGECLVTRYGLEGGALYGLTPILQGMEQPLVRIDFKPGLTAVALWRKWGTPPRAAFLVSAARRWRLTPAAAAILDWAGPYPDAASVVVRVKDCPVPLEGPRPIAEAISSAGGVRWSELDDGLMLRRAPGLFLAGEMIDWEAPTGGYLLQGCFATGTRAGRGLVAYLGEGGATPQFA
jgi:predicted flavoprotein YhiN